MQISLLISFINLKTLLQKYLILNASLGNDSIAISIVQITKYVSHYFYVSKYNVDIEVHLYH